MKKKWIYIAIAIIVIAGGIFIVIRDNKTESPKLSEGKESEKPAGKEETIEEKLPDEEVSQEELPDESDPVDSTEFPDIEIGQKLPDFKLENLDGEDVTLRGLEGKIVLVNFWATWCTWCDKEMPDLQKLKDENEDLKIVAVNVDETKKEAQDYIDEGEYDFEVLLDKKGKVFAEYLGTGLPASYFVDKEGMFVGRVQGMMTFKQMNEILDSIREM